MRHAFQLVGQAYLAIWGVILGVLLVRSLARIAIAFVQAHLRRWQRIPDGMFVCRHGRVVCESGDCVDCDTPDPIESQMPQVLRHARPRIVRRMPGRFVGYVVGIDDTERAERLIELVHERRTA